MNMGNEFWHQEIIDVDLSIITEQIEDFETFYDCFIDAIDKAKQDPIRPGWELRYDLIGWQEYKFFSEEHQSPKDKPDMRFLYHYDRELNPSALIFSQLIYC